MLKIDRIEIGLKLVGEDKSADLGTGTIRASFQSEGKVLVLKERLNRVVKLGEIDVLVALSIFTEMPSGPEDLESSSSAISSETSSSVHRYSCELLA